MLELAQATKVVSTRIRGWNVGASWSSKSSLKHILQNRGCSNSSDSHLSVAKSLEQRIRHHQQRAQELYHESYDDNAAGYVEECNGLFRENDDPFNAYDHLGPSISRPSSSAYAGSEVSVASSGRWAGAADERMGRCVPEGIRSDDPGCLHADAGAATKEGQTAVNVVASGGQKWTDHPSAFGNCEHKKSMPAHSRAAEGWARLKGGGCGSNKRGGGGGRVEGKRSAAIASWGSGGSQVARDRARHRSATMRAKQRAPAWYSPTDRGVE